MIIGLDIDGTINRHPAIFQLLSVSLRQAGHRVIIVTFRESRSSASEDRAAWGISYDKLITWSFEENGSEDMYQWKARTCKEENIDILFDDDPKVLCQLDAKTISMMVVDHEEYDFSRLTAG